MNESFRSVWFGLLLSCTLLLMACSSPAPQEPTEPPSAGETQAAATSPVPPSVSINALMVAMVDHAAHEIWSVPLTPPSTDEQWTQLEYHAIQLAGSGTLTSLGGTGPSDAGWVQQPAWGRFAREMTDAAVKALEAARARNVSGLSSIGDTLVATCEGCHKEFKPDLPTEGLVHMPHYQH